MNDRYVAVLEGVAGKMGGVDERHPSWTPAGRAGKSFVRVAVGLYATEAEAAEAAWLASTPPGRTARLPHHVRGEGAVPGHIIAALEAKS